MEALGNQNHVNTILEDVRMLHPLSPWPTCSSSKLGPALEALYEELGNGSRHPISGVFWPIRLTDSPMGNLVYLESFSWVYSTWKTDLPKYYVPVVSTVSRAPLTNSTGLIRKELKLYLNAEKESRFLRSALAPPRQAIGVVPKRKSSRPLAPD